MKRSFLFAGRVLCAAVLSLVTTTSSLAMVREVSFEELTDLSETTMEVVVMNTYAEWNDERTAVFTHYVVEPVRQAGGRSRGARFELLFAGGIASDGKQMIVTEVPRLEVGGQYILFLHPAETRHAAPTVGMWQGAFRVVRDPDTNHAVVVDMNGRLLERDPDGLLHRGRRVNVDSLGFVTPAAAPEPEPGMESEPVLRDVEGRVVPMLRTTDIRVSQPVARETVDPDTLMNFVHARREASPRAPRVNQ